MTVEYEQRTRVRQAAIAGIAAVLLIAAPLIGLGGLHTSVDELTLDLITIHKRFPLDLVAAAVQTIGLIALALTLNWLSNATTSRNPEIKPFIRWLAVVGAVLFGVGVITNEIVASVTAHDFVSSGNQTYVQANHLTSGGLITVLPLLEQLGALMLTGGFIWISLNGMRVGLLTRYMGYVGVIGGALVLFPLVPIPIVQCFWLAGLAVLFAGRWPTGTPPAWTSGVAVPWPASPQAAARGERRPRGGQPDVKPAATHSETAIGEDGSPSRTRANTPKRKRKRRH